MRSRALLLALPLLVGGCAHLRVASAGATYDEGASGHGRLVLQGDLALASVSGTPEEIGRQLAELVGGPMRSMREEMFELLVSQAGVDLDDLRARARALEPSLPADHRRELRAMAEAARTSYEDLVAANTLVDSCCTAFVASGAATRTGELVFARNMDFPPAHLLGPDTLVLLVRPAGKKAFVSIGWPGVTGVISGMNEDGLCAAILVNEGAAHAAAGTPVAYLVRELLETCATVSEARAFVRARPRCASGHFIMLADAAHAAVVAPGEHDRLPEDGVLTCSNDAFRPQLDVQTGDRACALSDLVDASRGRLDEDVARAILGATYIEYVAAQAMVFVPARRRLSLARGSTLRPAALQGWAGLDLAAAFRAGGFEGLEVEDEDDVDAFPHYAEHPYAGESVQRRARAHLAQGPSRTTDRAE